MMGALAEFERDLIVERTKAGIEAARQRGQHLGRPKKLDGNQLAHAQQLIDEGKSRNEVARLFKVDPSTLYRRLQARSISVATIYDCGRKSMFDTTRQHAPCGDTLFAPMLEDVGT